MADEKPNAQPNKVLSITRNGVAIDGVSILATDDGIGVEQVADDLYIARLTVFVESVEVDSALPHTSVTTYSPIHRR